MGDGVHPLISTLSAPNEQKAGSGLLSYYIRPEYLKNCSVYTLSSHYPPPLGRGVWREGLRFYFVAAGFPGGDSTGEFVDIFVSKLSGFIGGLAAGGAFHVSAVEHQFRIH